LQLTGSILEKLFLTRKILYPRWGEDEIRGEKRGNWGRSSFMRPRGEEEKRPGLKGRFVGGGWLVGGKLVTGRGKEVKVRKRKRK